MLFKDRRGKQKSLSQFHAHAKFQERCGLSLKLMSTFSTSPRVSDERPAISLAKSLMVNLPAMTVFVYHFFLPFFLRVEPVY